MKADKHNTPPQTLSFLVHLLPYKNGENGLITLLKTPISTTSTLHSQHFSLSLSLSLYGQLSHFVYSITQLIVLFSNWVWLGAMAWRNIN